MRSRVNFTSPRIGKKIRKALFPFVVLSISKSSSCEGTGPVRVPANRFRIVPIVGDGRCLFRSVAEGWIRLEGGAIHNEEEQRSLADDLRQRAVEELKRRKDEVQWFIEGDFDVYVVEMSKPQAWGGEPEILMLAHVLKRPIHVYMPEKQEWYVRIMGYGDDHREVCTLPIEVLFHGLGHYEFMERIGQETKSKL